MKKKIVMMVANEVTSDPRVTKEAMELSKNYSVMVIGLSRGKDTTIYERINSYEVKRANTSNIQWLNRGLRKIVELCKIGITTLKEKEISVLHAHDFEMLPFAYIIAKFRRSRLVYDSHELWIEQRADFPNWFKRLVIAVEGFLIRRVDNVITVNFSISNELKNRYKLYRSPIIIHNFTPKLQEEFQQRNGTGENPIIVLYHGGYIKDRGLEELVASAALFPDNVVLQLRGMGSLEGKLKDIAGPLINTNKVQFLKPIPMNQLVKAAQSAHIGIIPYQPTCLNNYYSLPNKLSEYAMAGLAICASDLPEIRRINERYHIGELFDPYSSQSIAEAVTKLVVSNEKLAMYRERSLQWAHSEGNWEHESDKILTMYQKLFEEIKI